MKTSAILMRKADIHPKLRLGIKEPKGGVKSTGKHTVRMISDKITKGRDRESGTIIDMVKYVMEEDGEKKEYRCPLKNKETGELHYIVQVLSKVPENGEVTMEMKKMGPRNYVEILNLDGSRIDGDMDDEDEVDDEAPDEQALEDVFGSMGIPEGKEGGDIQA